MKFLRWSLTFFAFISGLILASCMFFPLKGDLKMTYTDVLGAETTPEYYGKIRFLTRNKRSRFLSKRICVPFSQVKPYEIDIEHLRHLYQESSASCKCKEFALGFFDDCKQYRNNFIKDFEDFNYQNHLYLKENNIYCYKGMHNEKIKFEIFRARSILNRMAGVTYVCNCEKRIKLLKNLCIKIKSLSEELEIIYVKYKYTYEKNTAPNIDHEYQNIYLDGMAKLINEITNDYYGCLNITISSKTEIPPVIRNITDKKNPREERSQAYILGNERGLKNNTNQIKTEIMATTQSLEITEISATMKALKITETPRTTKIYLTTEIPTTVITQAITESPSTMEVFSITEDTTINFQTTTNEIAEAEAQTTVHYIEENLTIKENLVENQNLTDAEEQTKYAKNLTNPVLDESSLPKNTLMSIEDQRALLYYRFMEKIYGGAFDRKDFDSESDYEYYQKIKSYL